MHADRLFPLAVPHLRSPIALACLSVVGRRNMFLDVGHAGDDTLLRNNPLAMTRRNSTAATRSTQRPRPLSSSHASLVPLPSSASAHRGNPASARDGVH
jgi:hypothetical protein